MLLNVITIIIFMLLGFMLLNTIVIIIIIIIIAMYRSQPIYILSTIIAKHQYPKTAPIGLVTDRIHAYTIRNISFNRNITFTYILRLCVGRFFDIHQMN